MGETPPTLLVLRALGLGDLLVAVPALRALRRAHPEHRLVLAAPRVLAPVAALTGAVDELLPTPDPAGLVWAGPPPEVAVNLHGAGPRSHRALDALRPRVRRGFGADWGGPDAEDVARRHPHERQRWCALLAAYGIAVDPDDLLLPHGRAATDGPTLVHPGAAYGAKRWPAGRFAEVAAALAGTGHRVLVTGSASERSLATAVVRDAGLGPDAVRAGATSLGQLCHLVACARLVVSGDTGVAHLASAFRVPSVVLFGPVPPRRWGPPVDGPHRALTGAGFRRGEPFADAPDPALLAVTVDEVLDAVDAVSRPARR